MAAESPFTKDLLRFLAELSLNNNKTWFDAHKLRYVLQVKQPFEAFVEDLLARTAKLERCRPVPVKDAVFRIYRDIRFSKDKTPYKTHVSAIMSRTGRRDMQVPGLYVQLGPDLVGIAGGAYTPTPENLVRIRRAIGRRGSELGRLLRAAPFRRLFEGKLLGEVNKIVPPEFRDAVGRQPLIANKQFYYWAEYPPATALRKDLVSFVMKHHVAARPVNRWLERAMGTRGR